MFKGKVDRELKRKKLSKNQLSSMIEFKDIEEYTKVIKLGEHISCKIRLQETVYPDKKPDINVDIRKFLNGKYPFKGGKQGIAIPKDKWLEFLQQVIDFTTDVFGKDVFYSEEPEPQTPPATEPVKKTAHSELSKEDLKRIANAHAKPDKTNWHEFQKNAKKLLI